MRKMTGYKVAVPMVVGLALAMGMLWGCGRKGEEKATAERVARVEVKESVPDLGTAERCMQGMMRDPKEAFHLSLMRKDDTAPPFTSEPEFTPETAEGTTKWITSQPPKQVSSAHGDLTAWGQAINTLLVPMSTVNGVLRLVQPTVVAAVRIPYMDTKLSDTILIPAGCRKRTRLASR